MTKMLDPARTHGSCDGLCRHVVARSVTGVSESAGLRRAIRNETSDPASNRGAAPRAEMSAIAFLRTIGRYRERVDIEIGKASEHGARWWSCRLVQVCEEVGWVRLDK